MLRITSIKIALIVFGAAIFTSCMSSPAVVGLVLPSIIDGDEKKLQKSPDDNALRLETGSYHIMYANAFLEAPAQRLPVAQFDKKEKELNKAKVHYVQGVKILRDGLEYKYPGINGAYAAGKQKEYLAKLKKDDVPFLYWTVAGSLAAYALDPFDIELGLKIPELTQFIKRAYELDPDYDNGALDGFFISFYGSLPAALGGDKEKAAAFFVSAVKKSGGRAASPYVAYVDAIVIPEQDRTAFRENLNKALAVSLKTGTAEEKLANTIAQNKARYYLKNEERFIPNMDITE